MSALLELKGITRRYPAGESEITVLKEVSLTINAGEMVAIIGASGSGKSTLMNIIGCLDKPSEGEYFVAQQNISQLDDDQLAELRREHFGFIFQRYHLLSHLTAEQNVEVPAVYAGAGKAQRRQRAIELLSQLGLGERVEYRPSQLSGGQQQRVSIARALMNGGQVILADEPTGALDSHSGEEVMKILKDLCAQGHTVIIVTHDPKVAQQAERIIEIKDGEILSDSGTVAAIKPTPIQKNTPRRISLGQVYGRFSEALLMAWRAMVVNKMRTLLTMLGIIIGIASVVSIMVIGDAAQGMVLNNIKAIGTNTISVYPGEDFGSDDAQNRQSLKSEDVEALAQQPYVEAVSGQLSKSTRLRRGNLDASAQLLGVGRDYFKVYAENFSEGMSFTPDMVERRAQVVVIDANTKRRFFPHQKNVVGETLLIGNMPATVIGVLAEQKSIFGSTNSLSVWLPDTTVNSKILNRPYLDNIIVRVKEGVDAKIAEQQITRLLTLRHGKKDIFTYNIDTLVKTAEKTTSTMQLFLTLVAVISLVVGGIGVMNIMLVSVTERTREIGIRMAVGARTSDVMQQFLIEAILVCLIGGLMGIALSYGISVIAQMALPGWTFAFQPIALISAFICSTAIGVIFGFLPARSAARLNPIDALARE
ncbi:macrolide ABC transporter ATP-binding protein/permease MacB [Providencia manganoxydans]|uniref:Macrolide ABC transporter ATP-binding protein/permease MacB n=1 Tax=Providencia manganoxydans TaxID=2923283 RepID=A0ABX7ACB3_9GAMM|nr:MULTISPECIES: macrolide ABC transporter ATP-binding protein/permease MacB [Providencia]MDV5225410.1 macrolide ABC transporter ATP-binding protein/permease MacB [Providencia rettgeri]ELR5040974.1 macrolide ABC transporter ATP-binding protein/permease MacB [Providencia stuartii]ELR5081901.1 macrolide ABC transporter ATP-binding protein/permease MacB [Providencia stuartii]MDX4946551.1 macrolide ABC transporter ATP-binding protein/permease MacB [Providencia manganoxydans]QQO61441.1 macrolide AB